MSDGASTFSFRLSLLAMGAGAIAGLLAALSGLQHPGIGYAVMALGVVAFAAFGVSQFRDTHAAWGGFARLILKKKRSRALGTGSFIQFLAAVLWDAVFVIGPFLFAGIVGWHLLRLAVGGGRQG